MSDLKTKKSKASIEEFLNTVGDEKKRAESFVIHNLMQEVTGDRGAMWGNSIVGYGSCRYVYASGREGDWMVTGFSPRKQTLTIYVMAGFDRFEGLLKKLGKFKTSVSCLYVKSLKDLDMEVLRELIEESVKYMKEKYP